MKTGAFSALALVAVLGAAAAAEAAPRKQGKVGDVNVIVQGGIGDYTGGLSELTQAGPTWGLTLNLQPTHILGWELGYDGQRNVLAEDGQGDSPALTRHGGYGMLKVGLPFVEKVRPFAGIGFGASYATVSRSSPRYRNDFLEEVPVAAGLEFNTGALTAGIRGGYHWLIDESFADPSAPGNPQGGYIDAALNLGARF